MTGYFVAAGVLICTGLALDSRFPHPDQTAASPEYILADQIARQKDLEFYARRVTALRLREAAYEREDDDGPNSVSHAGAKVFVPEGVFGTHAGAQAFGGQR
jgi:hypothetical protein